MPIHCDQLSVRRAVGAGPLGPAGKSLNPGGFIVKRLIFGVMCLAVLMFVAGAGAKAAASARGATPALV